MDRLLVPYYTRTVEEVEAAADSAPGLETREVTSFRTNLTSAGEALTTEEDLEAVTGMFWAIHGPSLESQLATSKPADAADADADATTARGADERDDADESDGTDYGGQKEHQQQQRRHGNAERLQVVMERLQEVFREQFWEAYRGRTVANTMIRLWMTKAKESRTGSHSAPSAAPAAKKGYKE